MAIRLLVGLGNPGPRYAQTRHNVGFMLLDRLGPSADWKGWKSIGSFRDWRIEGPAPGRAPAEWTVACFKPGTFMNESGRAVRQFAAYRGIPPGEMVVCYDDMALPVGGLRLRLGGSSGGHNGMQSIMDHLGTEDIPRLRMGIGGRPRVVEGAEYVLSGFSRAEREVLDGDLLPRAEAALAHAVAHGFPKAMTEFNKSGGLG